MRRLAFLCALLVACATPPEGKRHVFGYTPVPGGTSGGLNAWQSAAQAFVQSKYPTLTQCEPLKLGQSENAAIRGTTASTASVEGAALGVANSATWQRYTETVFQTPKSSSWAIAARAALPVPSASIAGALGLINAGSSHYIALASDSVKSSTQWSLEASGASVTNTSTTMAADGAMHDIVLGSDTTTLTAYVDGASQATITNYANIADEGFAVATYAQTALAPGVVLQELMYCYVPPAAFAGAGTPTVTFSDNITIPGTLMFDDEFTGSSLGAAWVAEDNWVGPLLVTTPESGCVASANVSVSGGTANLLMSANSRGSCPKSWSTNAFYNSTACGGAGCATSYTPGATTYDTSIISQKNFNFTYGRVDVRMKQPGGTGPGGDVTLWGAQCQSQLGFIDAFFKGPFFTGLAGTCNWPAVGSQEMDIVNYSAAAGLLNTTNYVSQTPGSPPLVTNFFGVNYYGQRWSTPTTGGFTPFIGAQTVATPASTFHIYTVIWTPTSWSTQIDGVVVTYAAPGPTTWIPTTPMYVMIWNQDTTAVTLGTLPQTAQIDYVRITCPPGVPCVVNHAP